MYNSCTQPQYDNDYQFYIDNLILLNYNKNKKSKIMCERKNYSTKHNNELLKYLEEHKNEHLTVSQIYNDLTAKGISIGYATVYRQL